MDINIGRVFPSCMLCECTDAGNSQGKTVLQDWLDKARRVVNIMNTICIDFHSFSKIPNCQYHNISEAIGVLIASLPQRFDDKKITLDLHLYRGELPQ